MAERVKPTNSQWRLKWKRKPWIYCCACRFSCQDVPAGNRIQFQPTCQATKIWAATPTLPKWATVKKRWRYSSPRPAKPELTPCGRLPDSSWYSRFSSWISRMPKKSNTTLISDGLIASKCLRPSATATLRIQPSEIRKLSGIAWIRAEGTQQATLFVCL